MTIPYTFAGATTAIPLANLDANFASPITLGNVAMTLSNTYNSIGNLTLTNVTISSASGLAANTVAYANASGVLGGSANMTFDGTNLTVLGSISTTISSKTAQFNAAGGSIYSSYADGTKTWRVGSGIQSAGLFSIYNATDAVTAVNIDPSGNVGIGVTPSSISSSYKSIELGVVGNEWSSISGTNNFSTNAIRGTSWTYGSTNKAFLYQQDVSGGHLWFYAPSGTAGTAISYTQAMTLDSSGNLFVGGTTQNTANSPVYARTTAKAWVNFSDNGTTCTINQSFNVSSITRNSTGNYGINFTSGIRSSASCAIAQASFTDGTNANGFINGVNSSTSSVQVNTTLQANWCSVVVFD